MQQRHRPSPQKRGRSRQSASRKRAEEGARHDAGELLVIPAALLGRAGEQGSARSGIVEAGASWPRR